MAKNTLLVIDDELDLVELVRFNLEREGTGSSAPRTGKRHRRRPQGEARSRDRRPDAAGDRRVRGLPRAAPQAADAQVPILMLTAKSAEADRVVGLELGADDYMTKPFSPRELVARVKALLRRSAGYQLPAERIKRGELSIDSASHEVACGHRKIELTATEFRLLEFLAAHPGFVHSRSALIEGALGSDITVLERTIDVHIMSLRRKLGKCGEWIETVRGFGYKFREEH